MKKMKLICSLLFLIVAASSCTKIEGIDQDLSFLNSVNSTNLDKIFDISDDNTGIVTITPIGDGVASFTVNFGHGTGTAASAEVGPGGTATHTYPEGTYTVTIIAVDAAGKSTTTTYPLTVTFRAPEQVEIKIDADMVVSATALYAKSFLVYYGDVANEVGTPMAIGEKLPPHTYPVGGPYDLKVVALSGGAATTEVVKTLFGVPITFESPTTDYFFGTFGAGQLFEKVANPDASGLNTSATVGKFTRGDESWSGTYSPLDIPLNFSQGKKLKVMVYNPDPAMIGKKVNAELESAVGGKPANGIAVKRATVTKSGEWEELVFDYSTFTTAEIPAGTKFNQIVFRYNVTVGGQVPGGAGTIIYMDDIRFTN
jgi:hypothetical protein